MKDLISIIVPIYKVEKYLEACIKCLEEQTYPYLEIILVEDGSPDNCGKICDDYAKKYDNIKVIHQQNGGVSKARNAGLDIVKGRYIAFIDPDDQIEENYIESLYNLCIENNAQISICGTKDIENNVIVQHSIPIFKIMEPEECLKELLNEKYFTCSTWAKLYKREIIENTRFNESIKIAEDLEFLCQIIPKTSYIALNSHKELYNFTIRSDSATKVEFNEDCKKEIALSKQIIEKIQKTYPRNLCICNKTLY